MTGLSNYSAGAILNYLSGSVQIFGLPQLSLALFTTVGSDDGTGFVEPVGNNYSRVQLSGAVATTLATPAGNNVLTMGGGVPAFVTPGMLIYDLNTAGVIPAGTAVVSITSTTVTMSASAAGIGVQDMDTIAFSAFNLSSGSSPSILSNKTTITFPTPSGTWGTCVGWGLYDQFNNLIASDFLGGYDWLPVEVNGSAPAIWTAKNNGYLSSDNFVFTTEYGGVAPVLTAGSLLGLLTVQSPTLDTFTAKSGATAINTATSGSGMVRKVVPQLITSGNPVAFAGGAPGGLVVKLA